MEREFIYEQENFLKTSECKMIIDRFETSKYVRNGLTAGGYMPNFKKQTETELKKLNDELDVELRDKRIPKLVDDYVEYLCNKGFEHNDIFTEALNSRYITCTYPQVQKSVVDDFFRWHHDSLLGTYKTTRMLAIIIYLNDVEEGCGGTTDFYKYGSIKPKPGKVLIFPATWEYLHRGKKVEKGCKYIVTAFVNDRSYS
jgi:hypothetical protein